ncbi:hypothetical protein PYK79_19055 [Streptomyces sp. ID05-04B]|nr:hypothetical protein [Streptomyces sp. ID05-04B]
MKRTSVRFSCGDEGTHKRAEVATGGGASDRTHVGRLVVAPAARPPALDTRIK